MGPEERRIDARAKAVERLVEAVRLKSYGTEQDWLTEVFGGEGYTVVVIASSKSKGDLDRLGRHDAASRDFGTEKKIP